jgi:glycerate 2-kinase
MKILVAPNSFKESLSASKVARAIIQGILRVDRSVQIISMPIADGGDGTLNVLIKLTGGHILRKKITAPFADNTIRTRWGLLGKTLKHPLLSGETALIEMTDAAGLKLVPLIKRNPLHTHTYGLGQLIKHALTRKAHRIIIGLGGSATIDGGTGMTRALGIRFLDKQGRELALGGAALQNLTHIDISQLDSRIKHTKIVGAYDVTTQLIGSQGAARMFGPQKGARPHEVRLLENNMAHLARIIQKDLGINIKNIKGGGAAGGLGAGLIAFLKAKLVSGAELFLEMTNYRKQLKGIDLVITGEGCLDKSSFMGKGPIILAQKTKALAPIPVILICGSISNELTQFQIRSAGIDACISLTDKNVSVKQAIKEAPSLITQKTETLIKHLQQYSSYSTRV